LALLKFKPIEKIKIKKHRQLWYVFIPGPMPEFPYYRHWIDALARAQQEMQRHPKLRVEKENRQ
jgi:hypothetical protein